MAEQFYTILTSVGKAKIANASALGQKINFTNFALGDGGDSYYNPIESQTGLKNEVWRGKIGNVVIDENNPNWIVLENIIPSSIGGFTIREAGVFDDEGNLLAIGKYPETYKPVVENGSAKDLIIKMILEVSNTSAVTLKIDPTIILATKKDIDVLSNRIKKNEDDIRELKQGSTIMEDLQTENKTLAGAINEALDKADQAFQSGVDRKQQAIVNINSKGVNVDDSMSFSKVLDGILDIETDKTGDATATAADILAPKDAYVKGQKIKGTIPSKGAATITPTTSPQTIPAGQYLSGAQTIAGVSVPVANVLAGVTIAGAVGTMPNRGALNQTITTNNGQVNLPDGYYTGGVIKAIFANLIASNVRAGVNIGGVVGTLEESEMKVIRIPQVIISNNLPYQYTIPDSSGYKIIGFERIVGSFNNGASVMGADGLIYGDFTSKQNVGLIAKFKVGYNDISDSITVYGNHIQYNMSTYLPTKILAFNILVWTK